jgi:hypothetical protein
MDLEKVECFLQVALQPAVHVPVPVARLPGSAPGTCWTVPCSPWSPPFAPPTYESFCRELKQPEGCRTFSRGTPPRLGGQVFRGLTSLA